MRVGPKVPEIYESGPKLVRLKIFLDSNSVTNLFKKEKRRRGRRLILESLRRMKSMVQVDGSIY